MSKGWKMNRNYYLQLFCTCFIIKISNMCVRTILIEQIKHEILKTNNLDSFFKQLACSTFAVVQRWYSHHLDVTTGSNPCNLSMHAYGDGKSHGLWLWSRVKGVLSMQQVNIASFYAVNHVHIIQNRPMLRSGPRLNKSATTIRHPRNKFRIYASMS